MGHVFNGKWLPSKEDRPLYKGPNDWKDLVPSQWWQAFYILEEHGIPTKLDGWPPPWTPASGPPPQNLSDEAHRSILSRVFLFAMWATCPDTKFKWLNVSNGKVTWFRFRGGISVLDVRRRYVDWNTSWGSRVSELREARMLHVVNKVPDYITGNDVEILAPTGRIIPLPKKPASAPTLSDAVRQARKVLKGIPEGHTYNKLHAVLYSPALEYLLDGKINGEKVT